MCRFCRRKIQTDLEGEVDFEIGEGTDHFELLESWQPQVSAPSILQRLQKPRRRTSDNSIPPSSSRCVKPELLLNSNRLADLTSSSYHTSGKMGDADITGTNWKYVEVGRVALLSAGPYTGKVVVIVEIIDHKRVRPTHPSDHPLLPQPKSLHLKAN